MAIDIGRGIQRIYIVLSLFWIIFFVSAGFNTLAEKELDRYKISENSCEVIRQSFDKSDLTYNNPKINSIDGRERAYIINGKFKTYILYSEVLERPSEFELYDAVGNKCHMKVFRSFTDRLKKNGSWLYLLIASTPIPLYFILLFIVRGFRKKDK